MNTFMSPQQSIMQQLLMAPNSSASQRAASVTSGNTINEIAARTFRQNGAAPAKNSAASMVAANGDPDWMDGPTLAISNNTPTMFLKCAECGLSKNSSEELEVHIKQEHLNWLPFQCPICLSERASDAQMREHLHSSHKKNMNKFIYVDNVHAKRNLQILMDRSFTHAMQANGHVRSNPGESRDSSSSRRPPMMTLNGRSQNALNGINNLSQHVASLIGAAAASKEKKDDIIQMNGTSEASNSPVRTASPRVPPSTANSARKRSHDSAAAAASAVASNTDALLAQINAATAPHLHEEDSYGLPEDPTEALAYMFGAKRVKSEFNDMEDSNQMEDDMMLGSHDPNSVLDTLFSAYSFSTTPELTTQSIPQEEFHHSATKHKTIPTAKKRVLGECSKCQKPVTAGARQMHMFYHLGKDHGIYRFRCRFDDCNVEHYRKDQMENHHSKIHGRIDPDMMEDRSLELYQRCQELSRELFVPSGTFCKPPEEKDLSMELIGTNNCTPGPTAAKAQLVYNQQLTNQRNKQREKENKSKKDGTEHTWQNKAIPDEEHPLECQLCHKTMQNRIRGFHILWHLAKDLGINRYTCKYCEFGHDRSQSVQTHGKREHGVEDCVLDKIDEYSNEIKDMSMACFGFQALFSQESRRRSKIPLAPAVVVVGEDAGSSSPPVDEVIDDEEMEEVEEGKSQKGEDHEQEQDDEQDQDQDDITEEGDGEGDDLEDDEEFEPTPARVVQPIHWAVVKTSRSRKTRRLFGSRKTPNKEKRAEMMRLREISMKVGGAQYVKKKSTEAAHCGVCGVLQHSRMSEHAYKHLNLALFVCPHCDLGNYSRETVLKHMKEMHEDVGGHPIDQRLKYAEDIKDIIRTCYPSFFVDAPVPTEADMEALNMHLKHDVKVEGGEESDGEESMADEQEQDHDVVEQLMLKTEQKDGDLEEEHEDEEEHEEEV